MKALKITLLFLTMLLLYPVNSHAQDLSENKIFRVHEDRVKLSMVSEYEKIVKEMLALVKKNNLKDLNWITLVSSDSRYLYVSPMKNMAELDAPSWISELVKKEGEDVVHGIFNRMDKCYDTELDYILHLDNDLTYMPDGFTQTPKGNNYRNNHMLYVTPGNRQVVKEKMKAVKNLFVSKNSKVHYRVYRSGFGSNGEFYMVAVAAIDAEDDAKKGKANNELFGKEGEKVFGELFSNLLKYESVEGWIRPELGYTSN